MDHAGVPGKRGGDAQQRIRTRAITIGTDRRHKRKKRPRGAFPLAQSLRLRRLSIRPPKPSFDGDRKNIPD